MTYELPRAVQVRLQAAIRGARNADAVMRLAAFLARFHTGPRVIGRPFTVDRVALAGIADLGLSEAQIRGALAALERIGLLERHELPGSRYRRTEHGLRRKPVLWRVSVEFLALFEAANKAVLAKRLSVARRALPPVAPLVARKDASSWGLLLGEQPRPALPRPDTPFEAAVRALEAGVFKSGA